AWVLRLSAPRTAGAIAGFLGQPAVLDAATSRVGDERIDNAYATLFAFSIVVKIFLVPAVLVL
ncbi:transporter, partial [Actinotignum timonense]|nr:transporter [Actinotignum timonense]